MKPSIIFSLDNDVNVMAQALMQTLGAKPMLGRYKMRGTGEYVTEQSWLLPEHVFMGRVFGTGLIKNQESVLQISGCNKQYAHLLFLKDGYLLLVDNEHLGFLKAVSKAEAETAGEWTYDIREGRYFTVVANSQSEAPHERDQRELWAAIDDLIVSDNAGGLVGDKLTRLQMCRDKMRPKWLDKETHKTGEAP
jgi:hypothetical protein